MQTTHSVNREGLPPLTRSQALQQIDRAFCKLSQCCQDRKEWPQFVKLIRREELDHRRFTAFDTMPIANALSLGHAVELFAVKSIFERFVPGHCRERLSPPPEAKDYFFTRQSLFAACAIVELCRVEILAEFDEAIMRQWLDSIHYEILNDPNR